MRNDESIAEVNDILSAVEICNFLNVDYVDLPIHIYDTIDSTNNEAKRHSHEGLNYALYISEEQTDGRGRLGRSFYSPNQTGIYMSLVYKVDFKAIENPMFITLKAAIAVTRAIEKLVDVSLGVKWVNDVYLSDKKIAGILAEGITNPETGIPDYVVVGIGINTATKDFPDDIKNKAASIDTDKSRNQIVAAIINELIPLYEDMYDTSFMEEYRKKSIVMGKHVQYEKNGQSAFGTATDIADNGGLIVYNEDGTEDIITSGIVEMTFD